MIYVSEFYYDFLKNVKLDLTVVEGLSSKYGYK